MWLAVLVATLAAIPYANTLANGFVLDDVSIIVENPTIRDVGNLGRIMRTNYWATTGADPSIIDPGLYRPLTMFTYAVDYQIWGLRPAGYHAVNLLLHVATSVLTSLLFLEILGSAVAAGLGAAVFAVHPVHTEAVSSIVGRAEVLATLFFLLAFRRMRSISTSTLARRRSALVSIALVALFYLAGLLSKETAVTLPAIVLVDDWLQRRHSARSATPPPGRATILRYAALGIALVIYFALRQFAVTERPRIWPGFLGVPLGLRILTASRVIAEYLGLFVFPRTLSADYWKPEVPIAGSAFDPPVLFSLLLWICIAALVWWKLRDQRTVQLGLAWFVITLLPASNVFFASGIGKAERVLYLPTIGLCLVIGWAYARAERLAPVRRWLPLAVAPLVLLLGARTWVRNTDWRDNLTLAVATLRTSPESPLMNDIAAGELVKRGDARNAVPLLQVAIRQAPTMPHLHAHLGAAYYTQGLVPQAIAEYNRALELNPRDADARANLGLAYLEVQQTEAAIEQLEGALRLKPGNAQVENNLGVALLRRGQLDRSIEHFQRALRLQPDYASARTNLDRAMSQRQQSAPKP